MERFDSHHNDHQRIFEKTYASHVSHLWKQIAFNVAIGLGAPFFLRNLMSINMEEKLKVSPQESYVSF